MAKQLKPGASRPPNPETLGLDRFRAPADDLGLSLDELSQAYSALLGGGDDPYSPAPLPPDGIATPVEESELLADLATAQEAADLMAESAADAERPDGDVDDRSVAANNQQIAVAAATSDPSARRPSARRPDISRGLVDGAALDRACEISPRTILEAMLFVGHPTNEPLTAKQVAALMRGVLPREIDELVRELNEYYLSDGAPYRIESEGAGYRLSMCPEFGALRNKFLGRVREVRLPPAAVDVLAIVAYNQPIGRDEIDKLRNKSSGAVLSQLVRRGVLRVDLVDERGRRPMYYTTDRFLELFRLPSLDDLPRSQEVDRSLS